MLIKPWTLRVGNHFRHLFAARYFFQQEVSLFYKKKKQKQKQKQKKDLKQNVKI